MGRFIELVEKAVALLVMFGDTFIQDVGDRVIFHVLKKWTICHKAGVDLW